MKKQLLLFLALSIFQCPEAQSSQPNAAAAQRQAAPASAAKVDESVLAARSLDPQLLRRLSTSPSKEVRCAVASNPRTPTDVLINMSRNLKAFTSIINMDDDRDIFMALTENPILPAEVIVNLDRSIPLEAGFEELPNMPARILAKRESYDHPYDPGDAEYKDYENLKRGFFISDAQILSMMAVSPATKLRWQAALNAGTPRDVLIRMAQRKGEERSVIENLARNPAMPLEYLRAFANHREDQVRHELAENPSCPKDVLLQLAKDKSTYVNQAARTTLYFFHGGAPFWQQ